jgi:hypothetical protein
MSIAAFALLEKFAQNANVPMAELRSKNAGTRNNARMRVSAQMGNDIPANLKNYVLAASTARKHPTTAKLRSYAREFDRIESTLLGSATSPAEPGMAHYIGRIDPESLANNSGLGLSLTL